MEEASVCQEVMESLVGGQAVDQPEQVDRGPDGQHVGACCGQGQDQVTKLSFIFTEI